MVNHGVTVLDLSAVIFGSGFSIPISGLYNPLPLPVAVNSDDYLTVTFVLAPGTYTVTYTATGTCDFNPSVAILGSLSIPVAHRSVDSEEVSGSVSITVARIGRYMLDPGGDDCDWTVSINQPRWAVVAPNRIT